MPGENIQKVVAGAVLIGVSILSGNALLLTVAGGMGINWSSEGLGGLWAQRGMFRAPGGTPLTRAYQRALVRAVRELRGAFQRLADPRSDLAAFDLLAACVHAITDAEFPPGVTTAAGAQQALDRDLDDLLFGHDERQVAYIRDHLLETTATAFQTELANDHEALTQFQGGLVQQIAQSTATLSLSLAGVQQVLTQMQNPQVVLAAVDGAANRIEAEIRALAAEIRRLVDEERPPSASAPVIFDNSGLQADELGQYLGHHFVGSGSGLLPAAPPPPLPTEGGTVFHNPGARVQKVEQFVGNRYDQPPAPALASDPAVAPQTILALFSSPESAPPLALRREAQVLRDILESVRSRFTLELLPAATVDDLSRGLLHYRPAIVHFSGHGGQAGLLFEEDDGSGRLVPRAALVNELSAYAPRLQCVILNACYSDSVTQPPLALGVPYVIAMHGPIDDPSAIEFTRGFYETLAAGQDIPFAYTRGCNRVRLKQLPSAEVPVLWQGSNDQT